MSAERDTAGVEVGDWKVEVHGLLTGTPFLSCDALGKTRQLICPSLQIWTAETGTDDSPSGPDNSNLRAPMALSSRSTALRAFASAASSNCLKRLSTAGKSQPGTNRAISRSHWRRSTLTLPRLRPLASTSSRTTVVCVVLSRILWCPGSWRRALPPTRWTTVSGAMSSVLPTLTPCLVLLFYMLICCRVYLDSISPSILPFSPVVQTVSMTLRPFDSSSVV
jgi:hypothetical protein